MNSAANDTTVSTATLAPAGIELGRTVEIGSVRIHRYMDSFQVTDLTNAGKRGKRARVASLGATYAYKGDRAAWMVSMGKALSCCESYDEIARLVSDILVDAPGEIRFSEREARGVDVEPAGVQTIEIAVGDAEQGMRIKASATDFSVMSHWRGSLPDGTRGHRQDTGYYPSGHCGKRVKAASCKAFFGWLRANLSTVQGMTIGDLCRVWDGIGVRYTSH